MHRKGISVAIALCVVCLAAMLIGFFIRPPHASTQAAHFLLNTAGGPVLFAHANHSDKNGAANECVDCHHGYDTSLGSGQQMKCRACHYDDPDVAEVSGCSTNGAHPRCIGQKCTTCHEGEACSFCHRPLQ